MDHVVCVKVNEVDFPPEEAARRFAQSADLLSKIPGVISVEAGRSTTSNRSHGFNYGIVVRMKSQKTLKLYNKHPLQQQVAKDLLLPLIGGKTNAATSMLVLDIVSPRLDGKPDKTSSSSSSSSSSLVANLIGLTTVSLACALGMLLYRRNK